MIRVSFPVAAVDGVLGDRVVRAVAVVVEQLGDAAAVLRGEQRGHKAKMHHLDTGSRLTVKTWDRGGRWWLATSKAQRAATAERRSKAIQLRLAGADWATIAARLGYSGKAAACKDLSRALAINLADLSQSVDELREVELMRLDRLRVAVWPSAVAGDLRAVDAALKISDRYVNLLGLAAPARAEVTLNALDAQILALRAELGDSAETGEDGGAEGATG